MTSEKDIVSKIAGDWGELMKKLEFLSKMSLEDRLKKLGELRKRKEDIGSELKEIDSAITYLDYMPDIARHYVSKNEFAKGLLAYINNEGSINYKKLRSSLPKGSSYGAILSFGLDLLTRAELIKKEHNPEGSDYTIKINKKYEKLLKTK